MTHNQYIKFYSVLSEMFCSKIISIDEYIDLTNRIELQYHENRIQKSKKPQNIVESEGIE